MNRNSTRETVILEKPHTHRRKRHDKGDKIDVLPHQAERLRKAGKVAGGKTEVKSDEA